MVFLNFRADSVIQAESRCSFSLNDSLLTMLSPRRISFALGALLFSGAPAAAVGETTEFVPVRAGKLKIDLVIGEIRASVTASEFFEPRPVPNQPREMFATNIQVTVAGSAEATVRSTPIGEGADRTWLRKIEVNAEFDQSISIRIKPDELAASEQANDAFRWNLAAAQSPVQVRFMPGSVSPPARPRCEIRIDVGAIAAKPGIEINRTTGSKITETILNRTLKQGEPVELAAPPKTRDFFAPIFVHLGVEGGEAAKLEHDQQLPPALRFVDSGVRYVDQLTESRIHFFGVESVESEPVSNPDLAGGFEKTPVRLTWEFSSGAPLDLGWMEPVESDGDTWLPEFGDRRRFRIRIKELDEVEAVRFVLERVSRHPGIAINANEAAANPAARRLEPAPVKVVAGPVQWTRFYQKYRPTSVDSGPDLLFEREPNSAFTLEDDQSVALMTKPRSEQTAIVSVFDWGASGAIRGQVKVGGVWEDLPARGNSAGPDKASIQIPLDADGDGIGDAWELSENDDGDGISDFNEYRGAYVHGKHRRLSPTKLDAFALDYTTRSAEKMDALREAVADEISLHIVNGAEHASELVGQSRLVVLEELRENALPALLPAEKPAEAWSALAPKSDFRTLFLDGESDEQLLARDLLRIFNLNPGVEVADGP